MPIYEYQCNECGHHFEEIVTSSLAEVVCRKCQSPQVKKIPSVFNRPGFSPSSPKKDLKPFCHRSDTGSLGPSVMSPGEFMDRVSSK
nr:zinc ribbon domain-containing protein [Desulfobacterales bacterium]